MSSLDIVKVEPIFKLLDIRRVLVRIVLQNRLLEPKESSLVKDFLTDLNNGFPSELGSDTGAVLTELMRDHVLDNKDLLENR